MYPYMILTDVSADIPKEEVAKYEIGFIPMTYTLGEESHRCISPESDEFMHYFYDKQRAGAITHTSQITPNEYMDYFRPYLEKGQNILYLALSSGLSDTFSSASVAATILKEEFSEVEIYVVDSLCATAGMGLLLHYTGLNRTNGMSISINVKWLNEHKQNICLWFMVDDLMYLKRGGRISAATAVIGSALNVKPLLKIDKQGKLTTIDKKRGTRMSIKYICEQYFKTRDTSQEKLIYIVHADCKDNAELAKELLQNSDPELEIYINVLNPITGAHTGPGMLAIIHMGER